MQQGGKGAKQSKQQQSLTLNGTNTTGASHSRDIESGGRSKSRGLPKWILVYLSSHGLVVVIVGDIFNLDMIRLKAKFSNLVHNRMGSESSRAVGKRFGPVFELCIACGEGYFDGGWDCTQKGFEKRFDLGGAGRAKHSRDCKRGSVTGSIHIITDDAVPAALCCHLVLDVGGGGRGGSIYVSAEGGVISCVLNRLFDQFDRAEGRGGEKGGLADEEVDDHGSWLNTGQ